MEQSQMIWLSFRRTARNSKTLPVAGYLIAGHGGPLPALAELAHAAALAEPARARCDSAPAVDGRQHLLA
eukprot:15467536-Alexandrium_andersonii.AAC.1